MRHSTEPAVKQAPPQTTAIVRSIVRGVFDRFFLLLNSRVLQPAVDEVAMLHDRIIIMTEDGRTCCR